MAEKRKTIKVKFVKSFMYGGKARSPKDTQKEPYEGPADDMRFLISNGQAVEVKDEKK
jgi:hypothetical protein